MSIAATLRNARVSAGISQSELARLGSTSQSAVNRYEAGKVIPTIHVLDRLLACCGHELQIASLPVRKSGNLLELVRQHKIRILQIADQNGIDNIKVFGSVARGDDTSGSDLDVLVDLKPGKTLLDLAGFVVQLELLLGISVDAVTVDTLKPHLAAEILAEAVPL